MSVVREGTGVVDIAVMYIIVMKLIVFSKLKVAIIFRPADHRAAVRQRRMDTLKREGRARV
jgi:hypothetical protein